MTGKYKERMYLAAMNAAEMIRGHVEVGLHPEDANELDDAGLMAYGKACERIAAKIEKIAEKYKS